MIFEAKFFLAGFVIALDDVAFVDELLDTVTVPQPNSCDTSGWIDPTTYAPPISTIPPITTPSTTTPAPFVLVPDTGNIGKTVGCNFDSFDENCGWQPASGNAQKGFRVGVPADLDGSSLALFALSNGMSRTYSQVSGSIRGNVETPLRRLQVNIILRLLCYEKC